MLTTFGTICAMAVAFWFYRSAINAERDGLVWLVVGVVLFYVSRYAWTSAVLKPLMGRSYNTYTGYTGLSAIVVGLVIVAVVRMLFLKATKPVTGSSEPGDES